MVLTFVQPGKMGHLASDRFETITDLRVDGLSMRIESFA